MDHSKVQMAILKIDDDDEEKKIGDKNKDTRNKRKAKKDKEYWREGKKKTLKGINKIQKERADAKTTLA